jgi:hypothetical protein
MLSKLESREHNHRQCLLEKRKFALPVDNVVVRRKMLHYREYESWAAPEKDSD